jgi:hypothetical protein
VRALAGKVALCYLARGADQDWKRSLARFLASYERYSAGIDHNLYVVRKGFKSGADLDWAASLFRRVAHVPLDVDDGRFDIGAYLDAAFSAVERRLCVLNTSSEIICEYWLAKLAVNLDLPGVALVGATGSFEGLPRNSRDIVSRFPNIHLRSNAFMIERDLFCSIAGEFEFKEKTDALLFESGPNSMTRRIRASGLEVLVVGGNGRGYTPRWWPHSETFRQGTQSNLLVADNQTRNFDSATWHEKKSLADYCWGRYLQRTNDVRLTFA